MEAQNISVPPSSLNVENQRLLTFADWNQPKLDKTLMSQIGFYFIGPTDLVKCHFCKVEIGMWQSEDNPVEEHLRWSPNCPLLNGRETNNVPIDAEAIKRLLFSLNPAGHKHSEYAIESRRLVSYKDWPKTMNQKPEDLAEAGFFFTGLQDKVKCFSCGGDLYDWKETDVPWEQHAVFHSKCEYLKLMKGKGFIGAILASKRSEIWSDKCDKPDKDIPDKAMRTENLDKLINDAVRQSKMCKICFEREYNTAFFPCGHIFACDKCALNFKTCPVCRHPITQSLKIYFT